MPVTTTAWRSEVVTVGAAVQAPAPSLTMTSPRAPTAIARAPSSDTDTASRGPGAGGARVTWAPASALVQIAPDDPTGRTLAPSLSDAMPVKVPARGIAVEDHVAPPSPDRRTVPPSPATSMSPTELPTAAARSEPDAIGGTRVQVLPPFRVTARAPASPATTPLCEVAKRTARNVAPVRASCIAQWAPPSVVSATISAAPAPHPPRLPTQATA